MTRRDDLAELDIPFNRPHRVGTESTYIDDAFRRGHLSGDGHYTRLCQEILVEMTGASHALLTTSCTHALEMAAILLDLGPGDEVIVPAFTFVSTANAFALRGARPVFCDVRPDTLNLDASRLPELITDRTRAIVPVHYAGVACDMDAIVTVARAHELTVVEDAAHALGGSYRGQSLGSFGALATLSFHETKNFSCGEGGALLINDDELVRRAEIIREKGTDRSRFFRGEVDRYTWVDLGSSYLPSDLLAAVLYAQLEARVDIQRRRARIWGRYADELADWADANDVALPTVPSDCEQPYHLFYMVMPTPAARDRLIERLRKRGILAVFHYQPLHLSRMGRRFGGRPGDCPVTESIAHRLVRLPLWVDMTDEEQARVIDAVRGD